jgi:hypothetical protein
MNNYTDGRCSGWYSNWAPPNTRQKFVLQLQLTCVAAPTSRMLYEEANSVAQSGTYMLKL